MECRLAGPKPETLKQSNSRKEAILENYASHIKRSGLIRLKHHKAYPGWQTAGIPYAGWVRSSGGQKEVYLGLKCGSEEKRVHVPPTTPGYRWLHLSVANQVTDGQCTIRLYSDGNLDTWASFDDIELVPGHSALSILGADILEFKKSEDLGGIYKDASGTPMDALQILKDHALNYARLRVWLDPADGYHNKAEILEMAARLKKQDIKITG